MLSYEKDKQLLLIFVIIIALVYLPVCIVLYKLIFKLYTNLLFFLLHHLLLILWSPVTLKMARHILEISRLVPHYPNPEGSGSFLLTFLVYLIPTTLGCYFLGLDTDDALLYNSLFFLPINYFIIGPLLGLEEA